MVFLGSCFGTCVPRGIWACFAEHFVSNVTGNAQTSVWTMKWPARRGAETCLIWHCLPMCFYLWDSCRAPASPRTQDGDWRNDTKRSHLLITQCSVTPTLCRDWYPSSGVECGSGVMLHSYVKCHFWTSNERSCCIHSQQWAGRRNGNAMVEFAFAADPCMTCESSSSPDLCFALPRIQSSVSLAWLGVFLLSWLSGRSAASFPEAEFSSYHLLQPQSHPAKALTCAVAVKCSRSLQREMQLWSWDLGLHFWPGKLLLEQ